MKLAITGTPGTGKTSVAKILAKHYRLRVFNEREFALAKGVVKEDGRRSPRGATGHELTVPLGKLEKELKGFLQANDNVLFEGHLLCEIKAAFDVVIVLRCNPRILETRIKKRGYGDEKILDNVFCEDIGYCKNHALKNYGKEKIIEIANRKSIKETSLFIIREIEKRRNR